MNVRWTDELARQLREVREQRRLSRADLETLSGVSESTITNLENNARPGVEGPMNPRAKTVARLVAALDDPALAAAVGMDFPPGVDPRPSDHLTKAEVDELRQMLRKMRRLLEGLGEESDL